MNDARSLVKIQEEKLERKQTKLRAIYAPGVHSHDRLHDREDLGLHHHQGGEEILRRVD
jgi:hypothetical protein